MALMPKLVRQKIFLARCIHCCPNSFPANLGTNKKYDGLEIVHDYLYYQKLLFNGSRR
jgi:hypothetical protein